MTKGKGAKPVLRDGRSVPKTRRRAVAVEATGFAQEAIDKYWTFLPPQSKTFIFDTAADDAASRLSKIFDFWSRRRNAEYTRGDVGSCTCGAALFLAFMHLKLGMVEEARALTIHGSFLLQCCKSSIEAIKDAMSRSLHLANANGALWQELPYFFCGFGSARSPTLMESFIRDHLPEDYTKSMTSFSNHSTSASIRGYIEQISDDWKSTSPSRKICPLPSPNIDGKRITIILADDTNKDEAISFDIGSSSTLKTLFNDYADRRGISLRSLRFSYAGSTLFLSKAGRKSPEELGMRNQDVIVVRNVNQAQEPGNSFEKGAAPSSTSSKKKNDRRRSNKKVANKRAKARQLQDPAKTLEEDKICHSKRLTKIHEEAHPRFREIRQRLSNLLIKQSRPKPRESRAAKHGTPPPATEDTSGSLDDGLGRRACKRRYVVHVGEVSNLYKTAKRPGATLRPGPPAPLPTLDLHGLTREDALVRLDESLGAWADAAMRGSYPFVRRAVIVCGCGSQILSETVEQWIRSNDNVSNAPTVRSSRRRRFGS